MAPFTCEVSRTVSLNCIRNAGFVNNIKKQIFLALSRCRLLHTTHTTHSVTSTLHRQHTSTPVLQHSTRPNSFFNTCFSYSVGGVAFIAWLAEGGGLQSRLWTAGATFAITMGTWHGYGAVQQWMDARLLNNNKQQEQQQPWWAKYKLHTKDTYVIRMEWRSGSGSG